MARPTKQGIDYFPLDCQFDDKIEMYVIEKGAIGLSVLISVWQMIYSNEGYYIQNNKDLHLLLKRRINVDANEVSDCINVCLERNIFDKSLHKKHHILTSKAIQKRYLEAGKKKKEIKIVDTFLLIGVSAYENLVSVGTNSIDSCGNATNVNVKEEEDVKEKEDVNVLGAREQKFADQLRPFLNNPYDQELLENFYSYWTEPNKSKTQLRFEMEKTWDLKRRLSYWDKNNKNFRGINASNKRTKEDIEKSAKERLKRVFDIDDQEPYSQDRR